MNTYPTFSKSAPTQHTEFDAHGIPLAPCEYQDHGSDIQSLRRIKTTLDDNTTRLEAITDSIMTMIARIQ